MALENNHQQNSALSQGFGYGQTQVVQVEVTPYTPQELRQDIQDARK